MPAQSLPPPLPSRIDGPVVLIGDVHGQLDQLEQLLARISCHPAFAERWIVFLGDLVDRGPDPRGVIECVLDLMKRHPRTTITCGNHDLAMAGSLKLVPAPEEADWRRRWRRGYQSETTFASYGVSPGDFEGLGDAIPDDHATLLASLPWVVEHPRVICVHAGLTPELPTPTQLQVLRHRDFTLHRPPWLCRKDLGTDVSPRDCLVPIASGHVAYPKPHIGKKRIMLDCTGGMGGDLTALLLPEYEVVTSSHNASRARTSWWPFSRKAA